MEKGYTDFFEGVSQTEKRKARKKGDRDSWRCSVFCGGGGVILCVWGGGCCFFGGVGMLKQGREEKSSSPYIFFKEGSRKKLLSWFRIQSPFYRQHRPLAKRTGRKEDSGRGDTNRSARVRVVENYLAS